jgi:type VI secretion system protein ImpL
MAAQPFLDDFKRQQSAILAIIQGQPDPALQLASIHFGGPGYGDITQSPFTLAKNAMDQYAAQMFQSPDLDKGDDLTSTLRHAVLNSLEVFLITAAANRLDELWSTQVVTAVQFLNPEDTNKALYGPDGLILKFQQGKAAAFLNKLNTGYAARKWGKHTFPFTDDFLRLLTVGNVAFQSPPQDSYNVTISALATLVDAEAKEKPERTTITIKSADSVQTMDNFNYPISKVFVWKPDSGGEIDLTIAFPSLELYVNWSGTNAFPSFVSDILRDDLRFTPDDFPDHSEQLKSMGIKEIHLFIQADGALPVVRHLDLVPLPLPSSIIKPKTAPAT